jgi:hypothetical protein
MTLTGKARLQANPAPAREYHGRYRDAAHREQCCAIPHGVSTYDSTDHESHEDRTRHETTGFRWAD